MDYGKIEWEKVGWKLGYFHVLKIFSPKCLIITKGNDNFTLAKAL